MKPSCAVRIHRQALLLLSLVIFLHNDYSPCIVKFDDILYDFSLHSYLLLSYFCQWQQYAAFSALTLLVGCQEEHPDCKK